MMEDKSSMDMHDEGCGCGHCHGGMCRGWHRMPVFGFICWALILSAVFAVGYCLGEVKGQYFDGWNSHRMMMYQGGMMPQRMRMMDGMEDQMQGGGAMDTMKGGKMMMVRPGTTDDAPAVLPSGTIMRY